MRNLIRYCFKPTICMQIRHLSLNFSIPFSAVVLYFEFFVTILRRFKILYFLFQSSKKITGKLGEKKQIQKQLRRLTLNSQYRIRKKQNKLIIDINH